MTPTKYMPTNGFSGLLKGTDVATQWNQANGQADASSQQNRMAPPVNMSTGIISGKNPALENGITQPGNGTVAGGSGGTKAELAWGQVIQGPAGTGGLEPNPNGTGGGSPYEPGISHTFTTPGTTPGSTGFVNGKAPANTGIGSQPGGGGVVIGTSTTPTNAGSVSLPSGWGSYTPEQKIAFFNQSGATTSTLKQGGVTDAEIAWMKQNGYTGGDGATTGGVTVGAVVGTKPVETNLPAEWSSFNAEQKINWFNNNTTRPSTLLASGVTPEEIAWMRANGYNVQDETQGGGGGTEPPVTSGTSGQGVWNVDPNQTVASQFASLTDPNSALMQQARARAMQGMNSRGLINSTMAQTAADSAMYDAAIPIAKQDAATYADAAKTNAGFTQQWNINEKNNQLQREMQQASIAAQSALQSGSIQAQQAMQQASQTFQGLQSGAANSTYIYTWLNEQIASIYKSDLSTDAKQKLIDQITAQANSSLASMATLTQTLVSGAQALGLPPRK